MLLALNRTKHCHIMKTSMYCKKRKTGKLSKNRFYQRNWHNYYNYMDQNLERRWIGSLRLEGVGYVLWDAIFVIFFWYKWSQKSMYEKLRQTLSQIDADFFYFFMIKLAGANQPLSITYIDAFGKAPRSACAPEISW